ncbi:MAG TPA: hypothetical protein DEF36_00945 [Desulfotomaculum sp.]|nr:hypothetical protein [Desulfotomaculum sp.]
MNYGDKQESFIIDNMKEGILTIDFKGIITSLNPAAERILEIKREDVVNSTLAETFFGLEENDDFNQTILDAVYETSVTHNRVVSYCTGQKTKTLFLTTSFLQSVEGGKVQRKGVVAVFNDITELQELRDAVKAMEKIKELNRDLELRNRFISETFGRYLSDEVVRNLISQPGTLKLGGEKRLVTIVLTDLRGFTSMSGELAPDTVVTILNNYLGVMVDIILKYNGTILEFIGDSILAIFGAPVSTEDHAALAVACCIEMQQAMGKVNQWNFENGFSEMEMGIGINTGQVVVGNIGSERRTKYGVVGSQVNLAARIESYTVGGQILASGETIQSAGSPVKINSSLEVHPKGIEEAITIYEIGGIGEPYNLYLAGQNSELKTLAKKIPVRIFTLNDKHCEENFISGYLVKLSLKEAELWSGIKMAPMANIKVLIPDQKGHILAGEIYAKVRKAEINNTFMVRFTSVSREAKKYFLGILEQETSQPG